MTQLQITPVQNNWLELTWYTLEQLPDGERRTELKCSYYGPNQLDLLQADAQAMGTDLAAHMPMLTAWAASYVPPEPARLTPADFEMALDRHLDATAQARRYDSRITCMLRAGFAGPFQAEGVAFASWADACNAIAYKFLSEYEAGTRQLPTSTQGLIDALPPMVWPE